MMGDQRLLRLGAQTAEVDALYAHVLEATYPRAERRRLAALAEAAAGLAETARTAARGGRSSASRTRLERRIIHARRTTQRIITRSTRGPR
ncbi:hypothetical protein E1281_33985 [Actinomadura sp. KC345]|uniref:hypothetical protein n=1 Tax=Actinomadura sp. KC345 TaxID=2530371 RepID=UPI001052EBE5|nr:hypothetical protein [Actinomadura sp. KC345]TDC44440.1 hypothetical protein E1281_33985 [Actinomadura sp. KC345]